MTDKAKEYLEVFLDCGGSYKVTKRGTDTLYEVQLKRGEELYGTYLEASEDYEHTPKALELMLFEALRFAKEQK